MHKQHNWQVHETPHWSGKKTNTLLEWTGQQSHLCPFWSESKVQTLARWRAKCATHLPQSSRKCQLSLAIKRKLDRIVRSKQQNKTNSQTSTKNTDWFSLVYQRPQWRTLRWSYSIFLTLGMVLFWKPWQKSIGIFIRYKTALNNNFNRT